MNSIFADTIKDYLIHLERIKRTSPNTVKAYQKDLYQFKDFLLEKNINRFEEIKERTFRHFILKLTESKLTRTTISRKLSVLRSYYKFLMQNGFIEKNPLSYIKNPKTTRKLPEIITLDSYEKILKLIEEETDIPKRNIYFKKLIFELLYGCAIRVSELCNLNFGDIDLDRKSIRILGKGQKERIVPLGEKSIQIYKDYLTSIESNNSKDPVFITSKNKRIYSKFVYRLVNKYFSKVSDVSKKSPHVLRHTAATHMLDNGADLLAVKEILGHENLSTTQIYTHVSVERLKKAYKNAHPKS